MMTALIFASFIFCREIRLQNMLAITTNQLYLICYKKKSLTALTLQLPRKEIDCIHQSNVHDLN